MANASPRAGSPIRRAAAFLLVIATLAACASPPVQSVRVIATLAPGVVITDSRGFERMVFQRTAVQVGVLAPVSERMYALAVRCEQADAGCTRARQALLDSGLFAAIADDRRRSGR